MKSFYLLLFSLLSLFGKAQSVNADPALGLINIENILNTSVDPGSLMLGETVQLKLPIKNLNLTNALPAGTCKIKIGLGSKLELDPSFDLGNANTTAYFNWISENQGGQIQLTGDLIASFPPNFEITGIFLIRGSALGSSTITANFLVTNHNSTVFLSDENGNNNTSAQAYTVIQPIPVKFTAISAGIENCSNINVRFSAENEINVDRYEIETSANGSLFIKKGRVTAQNLINYNYSFNLTDAELNYKTLFLRVKSVDRDNTFQYTKTVALKYTCKSDEVYLLYPNPVSYNNSYINIKLINATGITKVDLKILDNTGKNIATYLQLPLSANGTKLNISNLAAGKYLVLLYNGQRNKTITSSFVKK